METMKAIAKRKSTRGFTDKPVAESDLDAILAAGCAAPIGAGDYASIHLTMITGKAVLAKITSAAKAAMNLDRDILYNAPALVIVSSSEPKFPNIQYANVGCVIENMLLAATDLGVDSIYLWGAAGVVSRVQEIRKELGIPEGFRPISAAALGYAAQSNDAEKELKVTLAVNYVG